MKFSSAGFKRVLPAWIALLAVGCSQMPHRLWESATSRRYPDQTRFKVARLQETQGDIRNLQKAEQAYRALYKKDAKNVAALHRLAVVAARQNKLDESIGHFQQAMKIDPSRPNLMADYGHALFLKGDMKSAETALKTAVDQNPGNRKAINNLAFVIGLQGRMQECLATYRRIHSQAEARNNLGYVHSQRGEGQQAFQQYSQALALDPKLKAAKHALSQLAEMGIRYQKDVLARKSPQSNNTVPAGFTKLNTSEKPNVTTADSRVPAAWKIQPGRTQVAKRVIPKRSPSPRVPQFSRKSETGDNVFDLAATTPRKPIAKPAAARATKSKAAPSFKPAAEVKSRFFPRTRFAKRAAEDRVKQSYRTPPAVRSISNSTSRHFPREATSTKKTVKKQAVSASRIGRPASSAKAAAKKTSVFRGDGFSWATNNRRSPGRFQNRDISTPAVQKFRRRQPTPQPFPKVANTVSRRKPTPKPVAAAASGKWFHRENSKRPVAKTKPAVEPLRKQPSAKIKRVGFQPVNKGLNLGDHWNAKPAAQKQLRRREASRFNLRAAKPSVKAKPATSSATKPRQSSSIRTQTKTQTKKSSPKRFANIVDWNRTRKQTPATKTAGNPFAQSASRVSKPVVAKASSKTLPKASGWAPKRHITPARVAVKRKPARVAVSPSPARWTVKAKPAADSRSRASRTGRVKLTPAPRDERQPIRFKLRSSGNASSASGRVKLTPNPQLQPRASRNDGKGRVRIGAR